jgi:transposase
MDHERSGNQFKLFQSNKGSNFLPKGASFNASYYTAEILPEFVRSCNEESRVAGQQPIVHSDNARPHTARQTRNSLEADGMEQARHPPYPPDLAASDFHLFSYLKDMLQRQHFEDADQLFNVIMALTGTLENVTLQRVFLEWMKRLRKCIVTNSG